MKKLIKSVNRSIRNKFGNRKLAIDRIFSVKNRELKSVLFFTTHKCASSFINTLFKELTRNSEYTSVDYMSTIRGLGDHTNIIDSYEFISSNYSYCFRQYTEIYVPLRKPVYFPGMEKFRQIYFLRDPRDVLVSGYFSFGKSHPPPHNSEKREAFLKRRAEINELGIDKFVLKEAEDWVKPVYSAYREFSQKSDNVLYMKYDLFKDNTDEFIKEIVSYLKIEVDQSLINKLCKEASPVQKKVKSGTHKRSGKSNQYKSELKEETVNRLNELLKEELEFWDFNL